MRDPVVGEYLAQVRNPDPFAIPAWRSPVYRTWPWLIMTVLAARLLWRLARFAVRHPLATVITAGLIAVRVYWGWPGVIALVCGPMVLLVVWRWRWPDSFTRFVARPARSHWRAWYYRRHWTAVMTIGKLAVPFQRRVLLPVLGKVTSTGCTDRVTVVLVSGQSPADVAARADNLAHGFGAILCRVRTAKPGTVILELVRRDALAAVIPALPIPAHADLRALQVGRREDGQPWAIRLHGTHLLIAGATGAGKASLLWWIVRALLPGLRPRTRELYAWLLSAHIVPYLGAIPLASITADTLREWRATLLSSGVSETAAAKAYRLLRAVLMTAAEDRIIPRNPCRIRGGGDEKPPERPVLTIAQVLDLADHIAAHRFRALILLATFASLRWGEAIALRRSDLDLTTCTVSIRRQYVETNGHLVIAPPKSRAGSRTVVFPATLVAELREHLDTYTGPGSTALVFTGERGGVLRRGNFRKASGWSDAVAAIGIPGLHFHDLRHTGNTLAAQAGVSLADLKARMGHDSVRAAMIYQHAAAEADQKIANTLDRRLVEARDGGGGQR